MPARRTGSCMLAAAIILGLAACQGGQAGTGPVATRSPTSAASATPTAGTDAEYLKMVRLIGEPSLAKHSDAQLITTGTMVCTDMRAGNNPDVIERVLENSGWTQLDAGSVVIASTSDYDGLCPDQHLTVAKWVTQGLHKKS